MSGSERMELNVRNGMDKGKEIINEPFWKHPNDEEEKMTNIKMNGIYIKDISMPKGGTLKIEIGFDADGHPMALTEDHNVFDVIPVHNHGRLVDSSYIETENERLFDFAAATEESAEHEYAYAYSVVANILANAPTIIPANKEK